MKATLATLIFLFIVTTVFAEEPRVFTDFDLKNYKSSQKEEETAQQIERDRASGEKQKTTVEKQKANENTTPEEKPKIEEELNCYSFQPPGSPYTWEHCKDKSGKIVRKRRI